MSNYPNFNVLGQPDEVPAGNIGDNRITQGLGFPLRGVADGGIYHVNENYFTHLFAGAQLPDDPKVYDRSGMLSHAVPTSGLDLATLWGTDGYFSTGLGNSTTILDLPILNLDYAGGESLFLWWLGKTPAPASSANLMGDCPGLEGFNGFRIRVTNTGTFVFVLNEGTTTASSPTSVDAICDGNLHDMGVFLDATNRRISTWVDGVSQTVENLFNSGDPIDTTTNEEMRMGGGSAGGGMPTTSRALVVMKFLPDQLPTYGNAANAIAALRSSPDMLLSGAVI